MSKLEEKLKQVSGRGSPPIGFGARASRAKIPPMLLMASLTSGKEIGDAREGGAGLFILSGDSLTGGAAIKDAVAEASASGGLGVRLDVPSSEKLERLQDEGVDFIVFASGNTPAVVLQMEKLGKVLEIDPDWPDSLVRSIDPLPVDALLLRLEADSPGESLTVGQIMLCHRFQGLARKPLLVALPPSFGTNVLEVLREAGVLGVILEGEGAALVERLQAFRQVIDELPPLKRRREPADVVLPLIREGVPSVEEEEEEEDFHLATTIHGPTALL